jgi:hypothetical protein
MTKVQVEQYAEKEFLEELIESNDMAQIETIFDNSSPGEIVRMISNLTGSDQIRLL